MISPVETRTRAPFEAQKCGSYSERTNLFLRPLLLSLCVVFIPAPARSDPGIETVVEKMHAAYDKVNDYQAHLEVATRKRDGSFARKRVLYTFKKPCWIRLDFLSPHRGMILIYPDRRGKVIVRPSGLVRFMKLHLAPDSFLLRVSPGQRIDQTDLGLLIENISRSLTDWRRSQVRIVERNGDISIRVLSRNHFRRHVPTLYGFLIDRNLWLPVGVEESTAEGLLQRRIVFRNLEINRGIPDAFFQLNGG